MKMEAVSEIITKFGGLDALKGDGYYIRLENPPYMRLVIEEVGPGVADPKNDLISVAHYYEQNGDAMRDPEIVYEVGDDLREWTPVTYQQDSLGIYQEAVFKDETGLKVNPELVGSITSFSRTWDRNIREQGFLEVENQIKETKPQTTSEGKEARPLTKSEKIDLGTKEITRRVREQLKSEFKDCKFSVTFETFSGGSEVKIHLMSAKARVIREMSEIPEAAFLRLGTSYTRENIEKLQAERYHQLSEPQLRHDYDPLEWCNGVYLTEAGHKLLRRVVEIADQYNYDESDIQTDYFNTNFYLHLSLGKWDKPFVDEAA